MISRIGRDQHRADGDADDDQPEAGDALPPCQQIDSQRGENAAGQRTAGDVVIAAVEQGDGDQRAGVSPHVKANHVRAAERVADNRLEDGAAHAECAA